MSRSFAILATLCVLSLWGANSNVPEGDDESIVKINPELSTIKRGDSLPVETFEHATDPYLEGYIQALIDANYYEYNVVVVVKDHKVTLYNLPKNDLIAKSIISYVQDLPGVTSVEAKQAMTEEETQVRKGYTEAPRVSGVWFPQTTVLFLPLIAAPREPMYSVNWRVGDWVVGKNAIAVALGDDFPIFRWHDVFWCHGDLQIGIQAGVWTTFNFSHVPDPKNNGCELMNTDYLVGIPLTFAVDKWSMRARVYHISGHLGDEVLCHRDKLRLDRRNPSFEAFDMISSYQFSSGLRLYGGPGVVFHSDRSFPLKRLYAIYGMEVRLFGQKLNYHRLFGTPFFAANMENWQQQHWNLNLSLMLGYEFSKLQGVGRKMRLYLRYYQGYSYEGQFFNIRVKYGEIGFAWGF
ncbi:MAG TPA: DUF1207 domain-containing protein [Rhabdochlamydiaceae bacterium]|nr:DUF1207 domain-containing protein [Rhabdochlamydiaceae bacterium]